MNPWSRGVGVAALITFSTLAFSQEKAPQPAPEKTPDKTPAQPPAPPAPAATPEAPKAKPEPKPDTGAEVAKAPVSPLVMTGAVKDLDGKDVDLASYRGKVVLIVNVASNCGFTPQYAGLEKLFQDKKDKGLVILAFPANDFNGQEPGDATKIKETCYGKYKVTFPMMAKVSVVSGTTQAPLFQQLAAQPSPIGGEPKWNFTKFLVDRQGNVVQRFEFRIKPDDQNLGNAIDRELAKGQTTGTK